MATASVVLHPRNFSSSCGEIGHKSCRVLVTSHALRKYFRYLWASIDTISVA